MKQTIRHIHFIGIGGIGMSALAEILHRKGYAVSGSDQARSAVTAHLAEKGITVFEGHRSEQVRGELVVYSSAIDVSNPELAEARRRNIPCIKRAELLGELLRNRKGICVAGTHGKTTTSAMIGTMLIHAGFDPTLFIGGIVKAIQSNTRLGDSEWIVAEADEFDRSFLQMHSFISVINNIEADHLDCYRDLEDLRQSFTQFANMTSLFGSVVINVDDPGAAGILPSVVRKKITLGIRKPAMLTAGAIHTGNGKTSFSVMDNHNQLGQIQLVIPGMHNVYNALAAVAVGLELEIPFETIRQSLSVFEGAARRFDIIGTPGDITVIDDYAHHPSEIRATLRSAKERYPQNRIIAVFQPHLYSRTRDFLDDFAQAFQTADRVILTDIYAAREKPIPGLDLIQILNDKLTAAHPHAELIKNQQQIPPALWSLCRPGDVVIFLGAGDITQTAKQFAEFHNKKASK